MKKFSLLAFVAAGLMAASTSFAGDKACCASMGDKKMTKGACLETFAKMDLTAEQKAKMETLAAECDKSGCTKESMAKMEAGAKDVLSPAQFSSWKSACKSKGEKA